MDSCAGYEGEWFEISYAREVPSKHQSHRRVGMHMRQYADERRTSIAELTVLVSWMLGVMCHEERKIVAAKKEHEKDQPLRFHIVFPVRLSIQETWYMLIMYADYRLFLHTTGSSSSVLWVL